jgi:hypothetical protein
MCFMTVYDLCEYDLCEFAYLQKRAAALEGGGDSKRVKLSEEDKHVGKTFEDVMVSAHALHALHALHT